MSSVLLDMLNGVAVEPVAEKQRGGFHCACLFDKDGSAMWFDNDGCGGHTFIGRSWSDGRTEVHEQDCRSGKEIAYRRSELERRTRIAIVTGLFEVEDGTGSEVVPERKESD